MYRVFPAKRAILLELNALRMKFFILIGRVITTVTRHATKFDKFSHKVSKNKYRGIV